MSMKGATGIANLRIC